MSAEEAPFIHRPDEIDDSLDNGLLCAFNADRQCGPDCMAFTTVAAESPTLGPQQKNCVLIVSAERVGRYLGGLVSLSKKKVANEG